MSKKLYILAFLFGTGILFLFYLNSRLNAPLPSNENIFVAIPEKTSLSRTVELMNEQKLLTPNWVFDFAVKVYAKLSRKIVHVGTYRFKPGMTNSEIIKSIFSGKNLYIIRVTYPEGIWLRQFAAISARRLGTDSSAFYRMMLNPEFLRKYNITYRSGEGYLAPGTFDFRYNSSIQEIADKLIKEQNKVWTNDFAVHARKLGKTRHEILALASIITAETPVEEEMPRISGVYWNRLRKNMKLQADPTVSYAIGEKRRLFYKDLEVDNRYNTYKYYGLPPGPINSPSASAIRAALYPEKHDYIYFVARGDGSNRHNFARTSAEHLKNVSAYRSNLKQ
jgi:UPF0755 protein